MLAALKQSLRRSGTNFSALSSCVQYQSVRNYPRKPRWVPIAKSKMFKNIVSVPLPKLESEEIARLKESYSLYEKSLWDYQSRISREHEIQMQKEARQVSEEVELERMMKLNNIENEKVRKNREAAIVDEWKQVETEILEQKRQKEDLELRQLEEAEKLLESESESESERLKGALKREDLDEVIERALAVELDYNFAVKADGKYIRGRNNNTEHVEGPPPYDPILKPAELTK